MNTMEPNFANRLAHTPVQDTETLKSPESNTTVHVKEVQSIICQMGDFVDPDAVRGFVLRVL
jgi:hypothetical protein